MPTDPTRQKTTNARTLLRLLGPVMMLTGAILVGVGLIDFFRTFSTFEPPHLFWCVVAGLPLLGIGGAVASWGFLGAATRYIGSRTAPVAKDAFNYQAENTQNGVRSLAKADAEGMGAGLDTAEEKPAVPLACDKCAAKNPPDSKFCKFCGAPLTMPNACPHCHEAVEPDARFCNHCGKSLT